MVQQTSLEAYHSIRNTDLGRLQQIVYDTIKSYPGCTDSELSEISGIKINVFTPRRGELVDKQLITSAGIQIQDNGHAAMSWIVRD